VGGVGEWGGQRERDFEASNAERGQHTCANLLTRMGGVERVGAAHIHLPTDTDLISTLPPPFFIGYEIPPHSYELQQI